MNENKKEASITDKLSHLNRTTSLRYLSVACIIYDIAIDEGYELESLTKKDVLEFTQRLDLDFIPNPDVTFRYIKGVMQSKSTGESCESIISDIENEGFFVISKNDNEQGESNV